MEATELLQDTGYGVEVEEADRHSRYGFVIMGDDGKVGEGTFFTGSVRIKPWIELHLEQEPEPREEGHRQLFRSLSGALEPGSHLMVHYLGTGTADALTADVPPPATPLGFLMWDAGFRWFKDWYFTEGWMEGSQKLQGNLPLDEDVKERREEEAREELEEFLDSSGEDFIRCKKLARGVLEQL